MIDKLEELANQMRTDWRTASRASGVLPVATVIGYEQELRILFENVSTNGNAVEELAKQILLNTVASGVDLKGTDADWASACWGLAEEFYKARP